MPNTTVSRRALLAAGAWAAGAGVLRASSDSMTKEDIIRKYYSGWERADWDAIGSVLAASFTFTSPNDDDHIDKRTFQARCWSQANYIRRFDLEDVAGKDNEAFVRYLCHTKNGKSFRNVEYFRFAGDKVEAIECYFGGRQSFPSAVSLSSK